MENKYPIGGDKPGEIKYDPIGCQHKLPTGFSSWSFQSESSGSGPEMDYRVSIFVCSLCGEIKVSGRRWDGKSKHVNNFNEEFAIHHPDAIDAIIKSANFFNEEAKWERVTKPAGAVWVKAHKGLIPDGIHSMKLVSKDNIVMRGTGLVNHNAITLITFLNKTTMGVNDLPKDYEGVYWLNESGTASNKERLLKEIARDAYELGLLTQVGNTVPTFDEWWSNVDEGIINDAKELSFNKDAIEFTEFAALKCFLDEGTRLWETFDESADPFRFTTKELYNHWQQSKSK